MSSGRIELSIDAIGTAGGEGERKSDDTRGPDGEKRVSAQVRALRCPFADECGYHGVFLYEPDFRGHMATFHPDKSITS